MTLSCPQTFWQRISGFRNVLPSSELHLHLKIRPSKETFDESNIHRNLRYCDRCHRGRRKLGNRFPGSNIDSSFPSTPRSRSSSRRIFSSRKSFAYQQVLVSIKLLPRSWIPTRPDPLYLTSRTLPLPSRRSPSSPLLTLVESDNSASISSPRSRLFPE